MSTLTDLLQSLLIQGAELSIADGKLKVHARQDVLGPEVVDALRRDKQEILRVLPTLTFTAPLSAEQEGLWFVQRSAPDSSAYNVGVSLRVESGGDHGPALGRALQRLVVRHSLLRTVYVEVDGSPQQVVHACRRLELVEVEAAGQSWAEVEAAAAVIIARPFDLAVEGALRVRLIRRGPGASLLLLCMHHIAVDGWSIALMIDQLLRLYAADGQADPLPPVTRTYQQYVGWQRGVLASRGEALRRAWLAELDGAPLVLDLPTDRPHPAVQTSRGATLRRALSPALTGALTELARAHDATLSTMLLAAFTVVLHRYSGQDELCVGFGLSRRDHKDHAGTFGYMVNRGVVRSRFDGGEAFLALVTRTHARSMAALELQDYPFPWLVKDLLAERDPGRPPVVQVSFLYQQGTAAGAAQDLLTGAPVTAGDARFTAVHLQQDTAETELLLEVTEGREGRELGFRYNADLFDAATVTRLAGHMATLLAEVVRDPRRACAELPLLTAAERRQIVEAWNRTETVYSSDACMHRLFEEQVDRDPTATALVDLCDPAGGADGVVVTYAALERRANRIADRLIGVGVGVGTRVGVYLERSADLVAGLLAVLKAGAAFVVLDPEQPPRRLAFVLADTEVAVIVSRAGMLAGLADARAQVLDIDDESVDASTRRPRSAAGPDDLAYVQYTSGTTGEPNGALLEHRGLVNAIEAHVAMMETGPDTRLAHVLSFGFDAALAHLFVALAVGGAVYLAPRDSDFLGEGLVALMQRAAITHTMLVPTMLAALPDASLPALRTIVAAGERCSAELVARWGRGRRFLNLYGPTEVSIVATGALCQADGTVPSIGRPIQNLRAYVVDRWGQLALPGAVGELWLGGVGVGRGYLKRPALTARKFIEDPFAAGRLYRTGDRVRHRMVDGAAPVLEFVGRTDGQVKLRGFRVELAEVEAGLRASPRVRDAVAVVQAGEGGLARLVAYVTPAQWERSLELEREQIAMWDAMAFVADAEQQLDLRGWTSSYTGEAIDREQMRAWVDATVDRVLELKPRAVLEVGCGTGMLLARLAPRVQRYRATDLSRHAVEHVQGLMRGVAGLGGVEVSQQPAHDFTGLAGRQFDTIIVNSAVQYFPSAEYLVDVIAGLLGLVTPGGAIFLGDVRNLALLEAYHAAVVRHRSGGAGSRRDLRGRVQAGLARENELVLAPQLFAGLRARFPEISEVEVSPKRGAYRNELSLFRCDVVLRIGTGATIEGDVAWRDGGVSEAELRAWVAGAADGHSLGLRGVANARLVVDNAWLQWLRSEDDRVQRWRAPAEDPRAWDPEALYELGAELGCRVQLSWGEGRVDGGFDAIVCKGASRVRMPQAATPGPGAALANDPLHPRRSRALAAALVDWLRQGLAPQLVPAAIVVVPALPITISGKVDVRALPPLEGLRDAAGAGPRSEAERVLVAVWCGVLGLEKIGIHDNFFELGGDSILSIEIVARAQEAGVSLRASQLFEHPTVAMLAAAAGVAARVSEQGLVCGVVPLTPIQQWLLAQELPRPQHFNQAVIVEAPADLDGALLQAALEAVVGHHDALRMRLRRDGAGWTQTCTGTVEAPTVESLDLSELAPGKRRAAIERTAASLQASLDPTHGPVLQLAHFWFGSQEPGRLLWIVHHLVVDAVSWRVLLPDLAAAYRMSAAGQAVSLPAKTTSFKRWAERLVEFAASETFAAERAVLALDPPAPLPVDRIEGRNDRATAAELRVGLTADETRSLQAALTAYNLGVQDLLVTAVARAVARWTGDPDVWLDLEGHGREDLFDDVDVSRTVGWFTSLFPVRLRLDGGGGADDLIGVKEQLRAVPRRGVGYGLLRYLHVDGPRLRWPAPQISFNYLGRYRGEGGDEGGFRMAWEGVGPTQAATGRRTHVLAIDGLIAGDTLELGFGYSRGVLDEATVARVAADVLAQLRGSIAHCLSAGTGAWTPSDFPLARLGRAGLAAVRKQLGPERASQVAAIYALTPTQRGILFHARVGQDGEAVYTTQVELGLDGALDVAALRAAWQHVIAGQPLLRSACVWEGLEEPVQVVLRDVALPWTEVDVRDVADPEAALAGIAGALAARPLALDSAPVLRLTLVRTAERRHALIFDGHHVFAEGGRLGVILRGVYPASRGGRGGAATAVAVTGSYEGYLRWLARQDRSGAEAYWRRQLAGFAAPTPLVVMRPGATGARGIRVHAHTLDAGLTVRLAAAAEVRHVTLATWFAGAWALLLARYSGLADVMFGAVVSGRDGGVAGIEDLVGMFIHTLPVRVRVDEDVGVWAWLRDCQGAQVEARAHQHLPLTDIQRCSEVPGGTSLFHSMLAVVNYPVDQDAMRGPDLEVSFRGGSSPTHYPLVVRAVPGTELVLTFDYDVALFEPAAIERMAGHLEAILRGIGEAGADTRLAELPLLGEAERAQVVDVWNRTGRDHDRGATIHGLVADQAARTPEAPAVYHGERVVVYAELERRANRLARQLQRRGVVAGTRVAVCLDRTDALVVALLAVLKAGGCYVPIDPGYPLSRQALMVADSGAACIVSQRSLASDFAADRSMIVALDGDAAAIAAEDDAPLPTCVAPDGLAYIIYTSGSTGRPKGVAIEHRNTVAMLRAALVQYEPGDLAGVSACASVCFDYSILELFLPLIAGGAVVLAADALALPDVAAAGRVRLLSLVPSAMSELQRAGRVPAGVRAVNLAGERLGNELAQRVLGVAGVERVYNIYGPTETTTYSTYARVQRGASDEPTLGRAIANTRVYLLDRRMRPVPIGVPGELCIGGEGVSRGYWGRPDLTAERFVADPFGPGRLYRTGDLGRWRDDGEIEYLGRRDHQVKLRGFRVELGEVEAALERIDGVEKAVVVVDEVHQRLVVHWIAAPGPTPTVSGLQAQLAASLPAFMVPELYLLRDAWPLTASGKIDRAALPGADAAEAGRGEFQAPETELEVALADIWREVLDVPRVGADDNFFRLGGHSLLALTMVLRVEAELGRTISIATLFQAPTLRELARAMGRGEPAAVVRRSPLLLPIQTGGARSPVFCVAGFGVHASYLHPLGPALGEDQPLYALQPLDLAEELPEVTHMEQLASRLADLVQEVQPAGPYTLSGHSAGARLALAIGFELEARGHRTALVVLDMHAPVAGGADRDKWVSDDQLLDYLRQMKIVLGEALAVDIEATADMPDEQAWRHIAAVLEREQLLAPGGGVEMLRRTIRLRERVFTLLADYVPTRPYPGEVVILSVAHRHRVGLPRISSEAWQVYCARPVAAHVVPGDHLTMIRAPHVGVVAAHLRRVVDRLGPAVAAAEAFPVVWDDPDDAAAMWVFDAAHSATPMPQLDFDLRMAPMTDGINHANDLYGLPLRSEPRLIHTFVYQKAVAPALAPDVGAAALRAVDCALRTRGQGLAASWAGVWLPEIQGHVAALHEFDVDAAPLPALLEQLGELRRRVVRLWQLHFELMYPVTLALSDFADAYLDLFPGGGQLDVFELLGGFPTKTTEANLRLWELGRSAARDPGVRALVVDTPPERLLAVLAGCPEGQALYAAVRDYLRVYGERGDDLYIDRPTWNEAPIPVLRALREAALQPDRDLAGELRRQAERREARLVGVRAALADHPRPVVEEFEGLLAAAQAGTFLGEEHNFWIDCKITFHARRVALAVGRRLVERGEIAEVEDVFHLGLAELGVQGPASLRAVVAQRQAVAARYAGFKPPGVLGVVRPFLPMDSALMRAMFRMNGDRVSPQPARSGSLDGLPGARGRVTGPARIVRTLTEAGKLRPGDVLIATATLPSWTPYFAIVAAVVTDTGGMLCHAAVVAREYGIPAVVGTRAATAIVRDGQQVEVDGDAGVVRVLAGQEST